MRNWVRFRTRAEDVSEVILSVKTGCSEVLVRRASGRGGHQVKPRHRHHYNGPVCWNLTGRRAGARGETG